MNITEQELETLKELNNRSNQMIMTAGNIKLNEIRLNFQQKQLEITNEKISQDYDAYTSDIVSKYGTGTLNPVTGEFTKVDETVVLPKLSKVDTDN